MNNPWFRFYHEFSGDPVIQALSFEDQRHYTMILCMKGSGLIDRNITKTARDRIIAKSLGLTPEQLQMTKETLMEMDLICKNFHPKGWEKRQYKSDSSTERVRNYRKNKETGNVTETIMKRDSNAPEQNRTEQSRTDIKDTSSPPGDAPPPIPYQKIVNLYHEKLPMLPRVEKLTDTRRRYIKNLWHDDLETLEEWEGFFGFVSRSEFLTGKAQSNGRPFKASLEWITKPANFVKISENQYHG